jgi:hypothetical protein
VRKQRHCNHTITITITTPQITKKQQFTCAFAVAIVGATCSSYNGTTFSVYNGTIFCSTAALSGFATYSWYTGNTRVSCISCAWRARVVASVAADSCVVAHHCRVAGRAIVCACMLKQEEFRTALSRGSSQSKGYCRAAGRAMVCVGGK